MQFNIVVTVQTKDTKLCGDCALLRECIYCSLYDLKLKEKVVGFVHHGIRCKECISNSKLSD